MFKLFLFSLAVHGSLLYIGICHDCCISILDISRYCRSQQFRRFGLWFYAYLCIEFEELETDKLYKYYKKSRKYYYSNCLFVYHT